MFWIASQSKPITAAAFMMLGFNVSESSFGHGGAYSTNTTADKKQGLIYVWLVQHGGFSANGKRSQVTFAQTAREQFGSGGKP